MKLQWAAAAHADLLRLHEFLEPVNPAAAARAVQALVKAVGRIPERPRLGEKLEQYAPREVRRLLVGRYEVRYEIREQEIFILRLWHTREDR